MEKKRIIIIQSILLIIMLFLRLVLPIITIAIDDAVAVHFEDKNMYEAIKKEFSGQLVSCDDETNTIAVSREDLNSTESMYLGYSQIEDVSGIENFVNLETLYLDDNEISNLEPLEALTNLKNLYLSGNGISNLSSLENLTNLESLDLSNNEISDISKLQNLTKLIYIDLSENQITDITKISYLQNLEEISLRGNNIENINTINGLQNLKRLYAGYNKIKSLDIMNFPSITELNLSGNEIENNDVSKLTNLQTLTNLDLSSNKISDITPIMDLTNLKILDLEYNQISNIDMLTNKNKLVWLEILDLSGNQISTINNSLELIKLYDLDLGYNQLSNVAIIEKLSNLTNLNKLTLSGNQITVINQDVENSTISKLKNLEYLYLSNNNMSDISKISYLNKIPNLSYLYLDWNNLQDISYVKSLENLIYLDLEDNKISNIDCLSDETKLTKLENLDLGYNNIETINNYIKLNSLQRITLSGNKIKSIQVIEKLVNLSNLKELYLNLNEITNFDLSNINNLAGLQNIQSIDLSHNQIQDLSKISNLNLLTNLTTLNLSYNQITDLSGIETVKNVSRLYLESNNITDIEKLAENTQLTELCLNNNNISNIESLGTLINLTKLELEQNDISDISVLENITTLRILQLSHNKINDITAIRNLNIERWDLDLYTNISEVYTKGQEGEISSIDLPQLFVVAQNENSIVYSKEGLEFNNCSLSQDGRKILFRTEDLKNGQDINVSIKDGNASSSKVNVVYGDPNEIKLDAEVEYSPDGFTNGNVIATIKANKELVSVEAPLQNVEENNIEESNTQEIQNNDENTQEESSANIVKVEGWTISEDNKTLTKIYSENTQEILILKDEEENTKEVLINISKIDKVAPVIGGVENNGAYSGVVIPTITEDNIDTINLKKDGVDINYEAGSEISQIGSYELTVTDKAGNSTKVTFIIREEFDVDVKYSTDKFTNEDVIITITANREVEALEGWTISEDNKTLTKAFPENTEIEIEISDLDGNKKTVQIAISNIDKTEPEISGIENGKTYNTVVIPEITEENIDRIILKKDGVEREYNKGEAISDIGNFELIIIDKAGNTKDITFEIKPEKEITSEEYTILVDGYITGIKDGTTVQDIKDKITSEENITVLDKDGNEVENDEKIKTGMIIKIDEDTTYRSILLGDLNGDGFVNIQDLSIMKLHLVGNLEKPLEGEFLLAADLNQDTRVDLRDLSKFKLYLVGKEEI